jgi:hypothetical protein
MHPRLDLGSDGPRAGSHTDFANGIRLFVLINATGANTMIRDAADTRNVKPLCASVDTQAITTCPAGAERRSAEGPDMTTSHAAALPERG